MPHAKTRRASFSTTFLTPTLMSKELARKATKVALRPQQESRNGGQNQKGGHKSGKGKDKEERNIDSVIFGDITFKAWYPSWYPKEIIGEGKDAVISELYVCPKCFGYCRGDKGEVNGGFECVKSWLRHWRKCKRGLPVTGAEGKSWRLVPGRRVYVHGGWPQHETGPGTWSVWEVDGDVETLFCQNLSLFAKLFLDNKSVFFDVAGFNYFLLVYTPPRSPESFSSPQIVGFFSKEKMSWDNNNLACILIFPPWQRKGLGALLIGVSYAIARREGVIGGPEKPISELGMRGYRRFWGAEIARWILARDPSAPFVGGSAVSVDHISRDTWISPEDCLGILRDMGVVERVVDVEGDGEGETEVQKERARVKIDQDLVRAWVARERVRLERVVTEDGFREGYAIRCEDANRARLAQDTEIPDPD